jgi:hypothetical protein
MRPPKVEWRSIAINDPTPQEFANSLQAALQMLSDGGYNILQMYTRGPAQIILAQRVVQEQPQHPPGPVPGPTMPPPPPLSKLRAQSNLGQSEEQFVYHFLSPDGPKDMRFTTMVEALRAVREHVDGDGSFVPGYLVVMAVTTFESPALLGLMKAYATELASQPPKQVD